MLAIRHETIYRYTAPIAYTIQQLRLTPRAEPHQHIHSWQIHTSGKCHAFTDAYGNLNHILTVTGRHDEVRIVAEGNVDVAPLDRGRLHTGSAISPLVFTVPTRLCEPDENIKQFAARHLAPSSTSSAMLDLAQAICAAVTYRSGATGVTTSAADALQIGEGVCQDHAHLFLACCHANAIPARYVSGYIHAGATTHAESHAWVDAWVEERGFSGWISIDVTHAEFIGAMHCRLAIGRDYDSASPVRGIRRGGGDESLSVHVEVLSR